METKRTRQKIKHENAQGSNRIGNSDREGKEKWYE